MIAAWLAHAYTASGAVLAFLAVQATVDYRFRDAFFWLTMQVLVDATDGILARRARVATVTPWFNGGKLDDIVDYLAYVFVPAVIVWRALLVPDGWTLPVVAAMLLASAYGFNRDDAKTGDHFFTGFPSYWNIVVLYLYVAHLPAAVNAAILVALAALVFLPVAYLYPSRTQVLKRVTVSLGVLWGLLVLLMIWQLPAVSSAVLVGSLAFPVYYLVVSIALSLRR